MAFVSDPAGTPKLVKVTAGHRTGAKSKVAVRYTWRVTFEALEAVRIELEGRIAVAILVEVELFAFGPFFITPHTVFAFAAFIALITAIRAGPDAVIV